MEEIIRSFRTQFADEHFIAVWFLLNSPQGAEQQQRQEASLAWLGEKARELRQMAEQEQSKDDSPWGIKVSRQARGGKREVGIFMQFMVAEIRFAYGKPHYDLVAAITNLSYRHVEVTADQVREACRPTTRAGRRRKPVHSAP